MTATGIDVNEIDLSSHAGALAQYEARSARTSFETGQITSTASRQAGVTTVLRAVSKVSRIFRDTIHLPCFTISMLLAYCYSPMKVVLNACESAGVYPVCPGA